ncbi:MAG: Lrp/AsnC family transcriptional regulator [Chloroflexi bacterium]|nr:Lrp/AsnC family transcriptional regulator [Chloroflexota bacterium]
MEFDSIDRKLLTLLQAEFPLTAEPYADLGQRLGIGEDEVVRRIKGLKAEGIVRQVSPVLDARHLGYDTTLVAMRVANGQMEKAEQVIINHPGVSHCYEREHHFNFWFTLAVPPAADMESELRKLTTPINAEAAFALPALKLFKINAVFDMDGDGQQTTEGTPPADGHLPRQVELSRLDRLVINEIQQDLPLASSPFAAMSARLGLNVEDFLARCLSLKQKGVMRRFGAAINHKRAGFKANAMTCWIAPPELVDTAGHRLASLREVSHCYERKTNPLWPYNLFAMLHGHTREGCHEIASHVSEELGLARPVMLYSTREFKKTRVKYLL